MAQPASPLCAGDFGNSTLQAEAAKLFRTVQDANVTLLPDLAAVVAQLAVQSGDSIAVYRVTNTFQKVLGTGSQPSAALECNVCCQHLCLKWLAPQSVVSSR
jgi:hypothetical protein